tara:strand:- start:73761 stop:75371 length:1611 start_codon:yes stop_codon:yes gene_type:complete
MKSDKYFIRFQSVFCVFILLFTIQCSSTKLDKAVSKDWQHLNAVKGLPGNSTYLKAHHKNGALTVFDNNWIVNNEYREVTGVGITYDYQRRFISNGPVTLPIDSIAIFETNKKLNNSDLKGIGAITILTGVNAAIGVFCLTNPKACFGSCPTFYVNQHDIIHNANAEGFSNAIAPSMAYADVDALNARANSGEMFELFMKNEALETHCIEDLELMAIENQSGEVLHATDNKFYASHKEITPLSAAGPEGDILPLVTQFDLNERYSLADGNNLSSKEELYFTFSNDALDKELGLALGFRQTLMTTYFIYSAMGYMGDKVGKYFADIERNGDAIDQLKNGIKQELGNIQIFVWNETDKTWADQGDFYETGPIAVNQQVLKLNGDFSKQKELKLKIVLNKGLWRIDNVALAVIDKEVIPEVLSPVSLLKNGNDFNDELSFSKKDKKLISMPGDEFAFAFQMPNEGKNYTLFLKSKGYYLEWMRESWIKDKDLLTLRQMLVNPKRYLKKQADDFKLYEETMEEVFWGSRLDTKTFSYEDQ